MAFTVTELITSSYYKSGVVGREFETVSGTQLNDGLEMLNDIILDMTAEKGGIPYFKRFDSTFVIGQEQYNIPGLIMMDSMTFFIDNGTNSPVRYSMRKVDRKLYWGTPRAQNILSLPYQYYMERQFGGAAVYVYFLPNQAYNFEIWGLFALQPVVFNQDLDLTLDKFFQNYLKYLLAVRICHNFNFSIPPGVQKQLDIYEVALQKREQLMDLTQQTISPLSQIADGINYAWANLGTGWSVP